MWSHYADEHKWMVIGFECSDDFFTSKISNIVPVQYGSIIYAETKPTDNFISSASIEEKASFSSNNFEILQRTFLFKSLCWAYEEEVRLVKYLNLEDLNNTDFEVLGIGNKNIYLAKLPAYSIEEVCIGAKCDLDKDELLKIYNEIQECESCIQVMKVETKSDSWKLKKH